MNKWIWEETQGPDHFEKKHKDLIDCLKFADKFKYWKKGWNKSFSSWSFPLKCPSSGCLFVDSKVQSSLFNDIRGSFYILAFIIHLGDAIRENADLSDDISQLCTDLKTVFGTTKRTKKDCVCDTRFRACTEWVIIEINAGIDRQFQFLLKRLTNLSLLFSCCC